MDIFDLEAIQENQFTNSDQNGSPLQLGKFQPGQPR